MGTKAKSVLTLEIVPGKDKCQLKLVFLFLGFPLFFRAIDDINNNNTAD